MLDEERAVLERLRVQHAECMAAERHGAAERERLAGEAAAAREDARIERSLREESGREARAREAEMVDEVALLKLQLQVW
jgi:hypothetical protein